ncbi:MAG: type I-MYXAN CRISPR-associated protein Cas6/Cmx6 [Sulfuricella denitrificans]|nr:type I-MYXAN CRISPR-associated protein Cas6/Cmx6 [Sulfuricella denitrificans]
MLPIDHGFYLYSEVARLLPWFPDEPLGGVHAIPGADTGHGELILSRRTKLTIRIASARLPELLQLTGKTINIDNHMLTIGAGKMRPLSQHTPLFAHCVATGSEDELDFTNDIIRLLDEMKIDSRFICGKRQTIRTQDGNVSGFSLMLHGLPLEHSLLIQQQGLGKYRKIGCGIFIPHKSITALT